VGIISNSLHPLKPDSITKHKPTEGNSPAFVARVFAAYNQLQGVNTGNKSDTRLANISGLAQAQAWLRLGSGLAQAQAWLRLGNDSQLKKHMVFLYNILIGYLYKKILYKYILIYKYSNISIYKYSNISICSCDPLRWKMTPPVENDRDPPQWKLRPPQWK